LKSFPLLKEPDKVNQIVALAVILLDESVFRNFTLTLKRPCQHQPTPFKLKSMVVRLMPYRVKHY
ncbi:MAG: hypothetical protein LBI18_09650, partial [Planctomycetaceae bacterium]|nr:hypothetical protein [Planctomycetaceae bacterium]